MNEQSNEELVLNLEIILATLRYTRPWHGTEQSRYPFHPVIKEVMVKFKPVDILLLALEYPHQSVRDASNVAYTQNERSGNADRQTVTTFGRYIRRHFPEMKDHEVRDYATKCIGDIFETWTTSDDIVRSVQLGPRSCMSWGNEYTPGHETYSESNVHPYRVYDPELGWASIVRLDPNTRQINGRALVTKSKEGKNIFVRSYKRGSDYSYADEAMEMWLREGGYQHLTEWPNGTKLKLIELKNTVMAPYLDGETQRATKKDGYLVIDDDGEYDCTSTEGVPYNDDDTTTECASCGDYFEEDDMYWVNDGDDCICDSCRDNYYVEAKTRYGYEYYHIDNCIQTVGGVWYHEMHLGRNNIVELGDERYEHQDLCIQNSSGEWFLRSEIVNDSDYMVLHDTLYLTSELFFCSETKTHWVASVHKSVEIDGLVYHEDFAPETTKETE